MAKPAAALAGKLRHFRPKEIHVGGGELLDQIDTAKDVVYTSDENPIPEAQQFQYTYGHLRTPLSGDARLCLPVEVPKFYHLNVEARCMVKEGDPHVGIGAIYGGRQFFIEGQGDAFTFGRFLDQRMTGAFPNLSRTPPNQRMHSAFELLVGDTGFMYAYEGKYYEWVGPPELLSLDPRWAVPAKDKVFLTFPDGQFDIWSIKLESLDHDEWLRRVRAQTGPRAAGLDRRGGG